MMNLNNISNQVALTVYLEFLETREGKYSAEGSAEDEKKAIEKLLEILDKHDQKITFFTVANLCYENQDFLSEIVDQGHEIASHALNHRALPELSEEELIKEVHESKKILEDDLGIETEGFRSPYLKHTERVIEEIEKAGYSYDSSMIPSLNIPGWFGGDKVSLSPFKMGQITEVPVSVNPTIKIPISGFFIRFLGQKYLFWSIKQLHNHDIVPVFYIHPFGIGSFQGKDNWRQKLRSGKYVIETLEKLGKKYEFLKIKEVCGMQ